MNCSGKHAAMILTSTLNGWPIHDPATENDPHARWGRDDYRSPNHPLQQAIRTAIEDSAGEKVSYVAVDGCGAPIFALSLAGLARSFGLFAASAPDTDEGRIVQAYRQFPQYASGSKRDETELMRGVDGLFCKVGAEGVYAVGLADGRGIAVKIEDGDGAKRARQVVTAATLRRLGVDEPVIRQHLDSGVVLGGGVKVGAIRPSAVFD
jgi:L-asparaginase II